MPNTIIGVECRYKNMENHDAIEDNNGASEPGVQYGTVGKHREVFQSIPHEPRIVTEEEIAQCYTLEEWRTRMEDMIESTHNHATGCVEHTPVVPRKCSIEEVSPRSMTIEQFSAKLYATVEKFYSSKE